MLMYNFVLRSICLLTFSHEAVRILASPESITVGAPNCKTAKQMHLLSLSEFHMGSCPFNNFRRCISDVYNLLLFNISSPLYLLNNNKPKLNIEKEQCLFLNSKNKMWHNGPLLLTLWKCDIKPTFHTCF